MKELPIEILDAIAADAEKFVDNYKKAVSGVNDDVIKEQVLVIIAQCYISGRQEQLQMDLEFGEWIGKNDYLATTLSHEHPQLWQKQEFDKDFNQIEHPELTTTELYLEYIRVNKK